MTAAAYVADLLALYRALPSTTPRTGPADRRLARKLHTRHVPLDVVRAALLLGAARRIIGASAPPPPVRSLAYFLPVIEELLARPLDSIYLAYLERRLRAVTPTKPPTNSRPVSCSPQVQKNAVS